MEGRKLERVEGNMGVSEKERSGRGRARWRRERGDGCDRREQGGWRQREGDKERVRERYGERDVIREWERVREREERW